MSYSSEVARSIGWQISDSYLPKPGRVESFVAVCDYLSENPASISSRNKKNPPNVETENGLTVLASKYFDAYTRLDIPLKPNTVPDEIVSLIMRAVYGYTHEETEKIKLEHQRSMLAENCVGALLERYLDSKLFEHGWVWCCGDFVKAIDFLKPLDNGSWIALQIKNRDNSENSSSSAIRQGTRIVKWFRTKSRTGATNWENLPEQMRGFGLSEDGFVNFVADYLDKAMAQIVTVDLK